MFSNKERADFGGTSRPDQREDRAIRRDSGRPPGSRIRPLSGLRATDPPLHKHPFAGSAQPGEQGNNNDAMSVDRPWSMALLDARLEARPQAAPWPGSLPVRTT